MMSLDGGCGDREVDGDYGVLARVAIEEKK